jgi:anthranilate/para-aminobenzoate synthase component I
VALRVIRVELEPDASELARRLSDRPGVVQARAEEGSVTYLACDPVECRDHLDPEPTLLRQKSSLGETPRWFGMLPYEALRHTEGELANDRRPAPFVSEPLWLRYDAVIRVERSVEIVCESASAGEKLLKLLQRRAPPSQTELRLKSAPEPSARHVARVRTALEHIASGNIYEVNLARRFEVSVRGGAADLLAAFERAGAMPHSFSLDHAGLQVVAVSPELCLRLEPDGTLVTRPIKGTRPRHPDSVEDQRLARELELDPKERAELTMIVDVERNDFGRVAELGSVHLSEPPHVVALPGLHHRVATVGARVPAELSRARLFAEVLPSGSVTGAPKRRAMQLIRELEPHRRGLYTGVVGFIRHDGGVELKMAIRTLTARDGVGHYFSGGGIVSDSVPEREVEETLWKAKRLLELAANGA